jgi:hypothetical protein
LVKYILGSKYLVLIALIALSAVIDGLSADFLVVLLEGSEILASLGELTFFHTFTDIPVDKGTFGVHQVKLVVETRHDFGNSGGVGNHAHGALDFGQVTTGDNGRRLVVDTALETGRRPVNELNGSLGLDGSNGGVDILGDDISSVHQTASHVLSVAGVALGHHGSGLENGVGDLGNRQLLVVCLLSRDDRSIRGKHEMDTGVRYQVGLELSDIDVQSTIESQGGGQRRDDLGDQSVQVGVGRSLNVQRSTADIVDGLVIKGNGYISVLQQSVGGKHRVVRLDNSGSNLRRRVDGETQLGLLTVVDGKSLQKKRSQTGTGSSSDSMEDQETLKTGTVVSQLTGSVKDQVDDLLTNGVVTTSVVVSSILLSRDQLLRVVQLSVGSGTDLINDRRLQIDVDGTGNVLSSTGLREKGVESIISSSDGLVRRHLTVRLDSVL